MDPNLICVQWGVLPELTTDSQVGGHEGIGTIVKMGSSSDSSQLKVGSRVGIKWVASACLSCGPCMSGTDGLCVTTQISGYNVPGTFQEYVVAPAQYVTPIPDGLDAGMAAPMLCGGLTAFSALKKSRAQAGEWVAVSGAGGGLGHLALQIGKSMGFRMIGLDMASKEDLAYECGAEKFLDIKSNVVEGTLALTNGEGVSAVVVCSGNNEAYATGLNLLKFNGTLVCVGIPNGAPVAIASAFPVLMVFKQLQIVGSAVGNRKEAGEVLDLASRGLVKTHFTLRKKSELREIFEDMQAGRIQGRVVLDMSL